MIPLAQLARRLGIDESTCRGLAETLPGLGGQDANHSSDWRDGVPPLGVFLVLAGEFLARHLLASETARLWVCGRLSLCPDLAAAALAAEQMQADSESPQGGHQLYVLNGQYVTWTGAGSVYCPATRSTCPEPATLLTSACLYWENSYLSLRASALQSEGPAPPP